MQDQVDLRTLFWSPVPVVSKRGDRDASTLHLNIRVLAGYSSGSEVLKLVRIYISNDADPSFLYSLDITDQHYGRVREEEQLLVDFAGFADKVAWLLHQCCVTMDTQADQHVGYNNPLFSASPTSTVGGGCPPPCRFRAILQVAGPGTGAFKLVESHSFKDLPHLTLQLRTGTDVSIKQFLAFRLGEVKAECARLGAALQDMHAARNLLENELRTCQAAAAAASEEHESRKRHNKNTISELQARLQAAEASARSLADELVAVHAEHAEAQNRAISAEEEASHHKRARSELEVELGERLAQLQEARGRAESAEAAAAQVAQRCQGFEAALRQAETRIDDWKGIAAEHDSKATAAMKEVGSLRQRCASADQETADLLQQLQEKAEEAAQLKESTSKVQKHIQEAEKRALDAESKISAADTSAAEARAAAATAAVELEEAKKKIEAGEKMVTWLNKQLTAAQLQAGNVARPRGKTMDGTASLAMKSISNERKAGCGDGGPGSNCESAGPMLRYATPPQGITLPLTPEKNNAWPTLTPERSAASLDRAFYGARSYSEAAAMVNTPKKMTNGRSSSSENESASHTAKEAWPQPRPPLSTRAVALANCSDQG